MANLIPADTTRNPTEARLSATTAPGPYTPAHHIINGVTKPTRLLQLGTGEYGKTALLEFPGGWQRTIDLPTQEDGWHPLFDELPWADAARLRKHVDHPIVRHQDGTCTRRGGLSFVTHKLTRRGNWAGTCHFDVPAQDYEEGRITGYRCASELLAALERGYGPHVHLDLILEEVCRASNEDIRGPSRRSAGDAFMKIVMDALVFMAKHARCAQHIDRRIAHEEKARAQFAELEAKQKAAFVERMKAAREAKRNCKTRTADA